MPRKYTFGEGTFIPDEFLIKNCGKYALMQLRKLIDSLLDREGVFLTAEGVTKEYKWMST